MTRTVRRPARRLTSPPSSTLFAAPAPSQSRSRLYSHGHAEPLSLIRGRGGSRSKSPWTEDESGAEETASQSSVRSRASSVSEAGIQTTREPSHRRLHLQKVFDLLQLSISRRDGVRAFRCLRILLKSHEWRPIELWRYALEVVTLVSLAEGDDEDDNDSNEVDGATGLSSRDRGVASKRLAFLRELSKTRTGLQLDIFIEIVPELIALGQEQEALAEIEIVLHQYPFRLEPILHLYSALIFLKLAYPSSADANVSSVLRYTLGGVSEADQALAFVPNNLLLLRSQGDPSATSILNEVERKFETVLSVGKMQSKRGREVVVRSRSRSRSGSRSRSRSKSRAGRASEDDKEQQRRLSMTDDDMGQEAEFEIGNDEWARNMARAYLAVLRASFVPPAREEDSDEEMGEEEDRDTDG